MNIYNVHIYIYICFTLYTKRALIKEKYDRISKMGFVLKLVMELGTWGHQDYLGVEIEKLSFSGFNVKISGGNLSKSMEFPYYPG